MIESIQKYVTKLSIILVLVSGVIISVPSTIGTTYAQGDAKTQACTAIGDSGCSGGASNIQNVLRTVINVLSSIGGIIAVIVIIIGGFKYMTSNGDSNSASGARNTILYAVVGLIIVAFSQIIVRFVLQQV